MPPNLVIPFASALAAAALATATLPKATHSRARLWFMLGMLAFSAESAFTGLSAWARHADDIVFWQELRMVASSLLPGFWLLFSLSYARGNAQDFLKRWRIWISGAFVPPLVLGIALRTHVVESLTFASLHPNDWVLQLSTVGVLVHFHVLAGSVLILMNLERTFRAAVGTMRWRIKFMMLGLGVAFCARVYTTSQVLLFGGSELGFQTVSASAVLLGSVLALRTLWRPGHFETDVYPSPGLLNNSVTVFVVGLYLLIVGVLAKIASFLGGDAAFSLKALVVLVVLVFLTLLLQSDHVRLQVRRFVSRHLHRPFYDYRTVWRGFAEATSSKVDARELCRALASRMAEVFQALSVSIWLIDESKEAISLAASTSLTDENGAKLQPEKRHALEVIGFFELRPEALDIDACMDDWATALREMHPSQFPHGGHRVCLPVVKQGGLLALVFLGDRVGGTPFSVEDHDMLACVGDHIATSLFNLRLSSRLGQAREFEAFQTMATFFVHDLKNAASTLNLMLKNLPEHYDNPEFRADALRGIGRTVERINGIIQRLGSLRHGLTINPVETDLNALVERIVDALPKTDGISLSVDKGELPPVHLDPEQYGKILTNLVLNAREAIAQKQKTEDSIHRASDQAAVTSGPQPNGAGWRVRISTRTEKGWAVLSVEDNGCGMSPEFLRRSLFRPFQTTKQSGIGIGMFQSKMIVEAHGGRIVAESEPGIGTTFKVILPLLLPAKPNDNDAST